MKNALALVAVLLCANAASAQETPSTEARPWAMPGEEAVDPYTTSDANAGAAPISDPRVLEAFHGREGIERIAGTLVDLSFADPRTAPIFKPFDPVRIKRTLSEQFCYILGGGCAYSGRAMAEVHKDMGLTPANMNALVENLQKAMDMEGVPFAMQNRLLARLAPMKRDVVTR
ncbi:MAG: group 1 truncated hemoglobin [Caulobacter sp.]|nr:group 1 truncated hemoglobin [Caulobacter sp.]